ncbi:helix-turn-helix domain-containing protein [Ottowia sp. VDI28]
MPSTAVTGEILLDSPRLQDVALSTMAQMLRLHNGNISAAAKALGVSRNTIYRKKHLLPPGLVN